MNLPLKTRVLNFFRNVFKIRVLEKALASLTQGKSTTHFFSKLIPNHYQYQLSSFRDVVSHGINLRVDIGDYIGHCIYFGFDGTEKKSYEKLFSLCREGFDIVDIGANIGYTSLVMSAITRTGSVAGFEPDANNYQQALDNLKRNTRPNVNFYNMGLGEHPAVAYLEERTPDCRGANRIAIDQKGIEIKLETLDQMFPQLNIKKIDLIKLDVEGYELKILKGARELLKRFKPVLFIELDENNLSDQGDSAKDLILFLQQLGYTDFTHADEGYRITSSQDFNECHLDLIAR
jgi:FkbM family methyltransferase